MAFRRVTATASGTFHVNYRLYKSANADGSSPTELTSGVVAGSNMSNLTTTTQSSTATLLSGASTITLNGEYLFLQIALEITVASGGSTADVVFRVDPTNSALTPPTFTRSDCYIRQSALAANDASGTTLTATFASNVLPGSALVAYVGAVSLGTTTLSDGLNGTWPAVLQSQTAGSIYSMQLFGIANTAGGACTVSFVPGSAVTFRSMEILEIANADSLAPFLAQTSNSQATPTTAANAVTSGTISYADGHHLILGMAGNPEQDITPAAGTGYASWETWGSSEGACRTEYKYETTGTSAAATFTAGNNSYHLAFVLAVLEQSATHNYTASPAETVTISESLNDGTSTKVSAVIGISEAVTVSESVAGGTPFTAPVSETITITDAVAVASATQYTANVFETVTITEATSATLAANPGLTETITINEVISVPGNDPNVGGSAIGFFDVGTGHATCTTAPPVNTTTGSAFLICSAAGQDSIYNGATPSGVLSDNKGNSYSWVGPKVEYPSYPGSGFRYGVCFNGTGGAGHTATTTIVNNDECTTFLVELTKAGKIQDNQTAVGGYGHVYDSPAATATGPYVAIAMLWGEGFDTGISVAPAPGSNGNSWQVIQHYPGNNQSIAGVMAMSTGTTGGTVACTFTLSGSDQNAVVTTTVFQAPNIAPVSLVETITLTEALGSVLSTIVGLTESLSITEGITAGLPLTIALNETVTVGEAVSAAPSLPVSLAESITVTDAVGAVLSAKPAPGESVTISEAIVQVFSAIQSVSESFTIADAVTPQALPAAPLGETITITDAAAAVFAASPGIAESIIIAEALATLASLFNSVAESITLAELALAGIPYATGVTETLAISDFAAASQASVAGVADALTTAESVAVNFPFTATVAESVAITEVVAPRLSTIAQPSEFLSVSENVGLSTAPANVSETITISDSQTVSRATTVTLAEPLTISEALGVNLPSSAQLTETVLWSDAVDSGGQQNYSVGLQESITISESVSTTAAMQTNQTETVGIGDTLAAAAIIPATVAEQFNVSESVAVSLAASAQLQEAFTTTPAVDNATRSVAQLGEAFLFHEVVQTESSAVGVSESWTWSDSITVSVPFSGLAIGVSHKAGAGRPPAVHKAGKWRPPWYHKK